jgi:hypothetical protein
VRLRRQRNDEKADDENDRRQRNGQTQSLLPLLGFLHASQDQNGDNDRHRAGQKRANRIEPASPTLADVAA